MQQSSLAAPIHAGVQFRVHDAERSSSTQQLLLLLKCYTPVVLSRGQISIKVVSLDCAVQFSLVPVCSPPPSPFSSLLQTASASRAGGGCASVLVLLDAPPCSRDAVGVGLLSAIEAPGGGSSCARCASPAQVGAARPWWMQLCRCSSPPTPRTGPSPVVCVCYCLFPDCCRRRPVQHPECASNSNAGRDQGSIPQAGARPAPRQARTQARAAGAAQQLKASKPVATPPKTVLVAAFEAALLVWSVVLADC